MIGVPKFVHAEAVEGSLVLGPALLEAIAARAAELVLAQVESREPSRSPYMTIKEAAAFARCKRQRIDDLLSSGRLRRYKEGGRTLVSRGELEARLQGGSEPSGGSP